jgi:hypothetical protein
MLDKNQQEGDVSSGSYFVLAGASWVTRSFCPVHELPAYRIHISERVTFR